MAKDELYTLDIPQREGKEGFIGTFFTLYLKLATVLQSPEFSKEPIRVYYMSKIITSLIPGDDNRADIKQLLKINKEKLEKEYRVEHKYNDTQPLTQLERDHILISSTLESLGIVSDFIDKHIGLSKKNKVGFIKMVDETTKKVTYEATE